MKILFIISALFAFPYLVYAQDLQDISDLCRNYTVHKADADVEYQAGFDVRGDAVVSAELDDNRLQTPQIYRIPLQIEQLEALNLPTDSILTPELAIGEVVVDMDADTITFNGQSINNSDLEVLCLEPEYEENLED